MYLQHQKWFLLIMIDFYYYVYSKQSSPNYASVNTLQGPLCGVLGHEGFEGVFLVGGRPTGWAGVGKRWRRRGIWMIGVVLQTCSQQQENSKQNKNMLMTLLERWRGESEQAQYIKRINKADDWMKISQDWDLKQKAERKRLKIYLDIFTNLSFVLLILF